MAILNPPGECIILAHMLAKQGGKTLDYSLEGRCQRDVEGRSRSRIPRHRLDTATAVSLSYPVGLEVSAACQIPRKGAAAGTRESTFVSELAYLVIREGTKWSDVFRLVPGQSVTIGRAPTNQIVIKDERCSRTHVELFMSGGKWILRDLEPQWNSCRRYARYRRLAPHARRHHSYRPFATGLRTSFVGCLQRFQYDHYPPARSKDRRPAGQR